jgi:hypothetical protein
VKHPLPAGLVPVVVRACPGEACPLQSTCWRKQMTKQAPRIEIEPAYDVGLHDCPNYWPHTLQEMRKGEKG